MKKSVIKHDNIMQASMELIAERGFHGSPMAEIAEKAGVGTGTVYCYFESKDVLVTELYRELEDKIRKVLQDGYPLGKPVRERFLYMIRKLLQYFIAHPLHFRYMEQFSNSPYGISVRRDRFLGKRGINDIPMDIFEEGISQQILKDLPVVVLFSLAFGPLTSLIRDHILGFVALDDTLITQTTEACWDAVKR
jgi:AcrR family transcriptional regulator